MSKVLIITGQFVPYTKSLGGVLRVYSFLQSLKKKNKIFLLVSKCLTKKKYGYLGIKKKKLQNIKIQYLENNSQEKIKLFNFGFLRNFFYLLGFDYASSINQLYYEKAKGIIKKNKIEYLIISSPPFSLFFLVKKIKSNFKNIKIILDYRDGWSSRIKSTFLLPINFFVKKFIEKKIINLSENILTATDNIYEEIKNLCLDTSKVSLVRNGFLSVPNNKLKNENRSNRKIEIGYFGLISEDKSSYRNIRVIYDVVNNSKILQKKIVFNFYGNNIINDSKIRNFKSFKFKRNLDYNKAMQKMRDMDYLLILHTESSTSKEMVTTKFYDYLASKTPIINISSGYNEAGKIIKKYKLGYSINYELDNLSNFFLNLTKMKKIRWNKKFNIFSRNYQNKTLLKIINK